VNTIVNPNELITFCTLAQGQGGGTGGGGSLIYLLLGLGVLFYFMVLRPESKKRKAQQAQLEALKKNDRVVTIGGIHGVVINVHREADEVIVRVDEATGTKIRVSIGSIARVVTDATEDKKQDKKQDKS